MLPLLLALLPCLLLAAPSICPKGFQYQPSFDRCYLLVSQPLSFRQAEINCRTFGANLVSSHSLLEDGTVATFGGVDFRNPYRWIGLYLPNTTYNSYVWTSREPVDYTGGWYPGQPLIPPAAQLQCTTISGQDHWWRQEDCRMNLSSVCEALPGNRWNLCEGLTCPTGYSMSTATCKCYKYFNSTLYATQVNRVCSADNATMVKVESAELNNFLITTLPPVKGTTPFIGLFCPSNYPSKCYWPDGTFLNYNLYQNFVYPWPENGAVYLDDAGNWNTDHPMAQRAVFCQKEPIFLF